ncbi:hypothetical protein A3A76_02105 [Candidatus Woesebacteria bacterium RIFCSPLOWO2_01_FULL_39_23]|uniref:L-threonylcarbamoyladenylate synthase n=1 Tax=Candidatus Woesebacteria bacterium RIFCSPHIGHO2_01_FULL_40_22 TaxID=1802499 RepID=A0A1F7YG04_9BACT|nr:MAG: hypothetical protein A2628_02535 [Candidatus Woesebacteria bacterium RIFCSPHIGHO2_01_FULL_40_22]OGM37979.1 MAG: hypothetical protein A3E41_03615 [Candidatus Woesebacteria bacterium RIFCSPHIGHO2_12_FULL_38_9]OGM62351.1 MAG: hypothetical protein A3A76_02105 [Candidatus Woesebacteria bacterium RIFCSPLOWO2_01_FULL_39_23]
MLIINKRNALEHAVKVLKQGGLVIAPTETLYGALVDATNPIAVRKLTRYKNRPLGKPYSIAVTNQDMAKKYVKSNSTAISLYKTFLPGPVTIISQGKHKVAPGIESENGTLGIRIPDYKLIIAIINKLGKPVTATSANASYQKRPYKISDILENISEKQKGLIDLIIDVGKLPRREPSTVIDTTLDDPVILRQGEIKLKDKNEVVSRSPDDTKNIAKELWQKYETFSGKRAIIFALVGEMGTGKTVFTKGLARARGIKDKVISPTYDIEEEYDNGLLFHIDAWRFEKSSELKYFNFAKKISDKSIVVIEWADRVSDVIQKYNEEAVIIWVNISYGKNETDRIINWGVL